MHAHHLYIHTRSGPGILTQMEIWSYGYMHHTPIYACKARFYDTHTFIHADAILKKTKRCFIFLRLHGNKQKKYIYIYTHVYIRIYKCKCQYLRACAQMPINMHTANLRPPRYKQTWHIKLHGCKWPRMPKTRTNFGEPTGRTIPCCSTNQTKLCQTNPINSSRLVPVCGWLQKTSPRYVYWAWKHTPNESQLKRRHKWHP